MVITDVNQVVYLGDGATTAFPFTFRIIDATDIKLLLIDADGTETDITSDYFVDTNTNTVYYPGYAPGAEPGLADQPAPVQEGQRLVVYRELPVTQEKDLGDKWPFFVIELALDKLTMLIQGISGIWNRCLRVTVGQSATHPDFNYNIPIDAGKTFRVKNDETGFELTEDPAVAHAAAVAAQEAAERAQGLAEDARDDADEAAENAEAALDLIKEKATWLDNVAAMKAAAGLQVGMLAGTKGYYSINDGGSAIYTIRAKTQSDVDDGGSIIFLDNGNVAELIPPQDNFWNVMLYGILPNTGDNYSRIHTMIQNTVYKTGGTLYFPKGKYTTSYTLFIPENTTLTGDGADSELYFDETDTWLGVCVCNAGSNVTIEKIKISQRSTGMFHAGSQPGCIGMGAVAKETAVLQEYEHQIINDNVQNLKIEDVYFDGFYPIQTETGATYTVDNVVYRNIYCPNGCVSVQAGADINNVTIENIVCDLFRLIKNSLDTGHINNVNVSNVICNTLHINGVSLEQKTCTIKNLVMTKNERHNDNLSSNGGYSALFAGNAYFENCYFTSISTEPNGYNKNAGIQEFRNCDFDFYGRLCVFNGSDVSYYIAENCSFKCASDATASNLLGYGKNNKYEGNIIHPLWGDIHGSYFAMNKAVSTSTHPNKIYIDGDKIRLSIYSFGESGNLFEAHVRLKHLPWSDSPIPIQLWNTSNRVGTAINTYGKIDANGLISVTEPSINISLYNRALIDCNMLLSRIPTPYEVFKTVQGVE